MPVTEDGFVYYVSDGQAIIGVSESSEYGNGVNNPNINELFVPSIINGYLVKKTANRAFGHLFYLMTAVLPSTLEYIESDLFIDCNQLKTVYFQETSKLRIINGWAFSGCQSLEQVYLPRSVEKIGTNFFSHCKALRNVFVPNPTCYFDEDFNYFGNSGVRIHVSKSFKGTVKNAVLIKNLDCWARGPTAKTKGKYWNQTVVLLIIFE